MTIKSSFLPVIWLLIAAISTTSCNLEINLEEAGNDDAVTFTCVIDPDTKLAVSDGGKTTWEVGDQILVHGEYTGEGKSLTVTLSASDISADGKTATINVAGVAPYDRSSDKGYTSTIYAAYPASAVKDNEHCFYYSNFVRTDAPLMAAYNQGNKFIFYNLCGLISYTVSGDFDKVEFKGNNNETVGYSYYRSYLVQQSSGTPRLDYNYTSDGGTTGPKTLYESDVKADGTTVNYIYLPAGASFSEGFTFKFYKGSTLVKVAKSSTKVNIARKKMLPLGDITGNLENPSANDAHQSAIPTEGATDLGADETANCYVVSKPGIYKFKAVQGNSSTKVGEMASAEVIWETWCNGETVTEGSVVKAVDFQEDYVYIQVADNYHPGNALVAVKNDSGKILWSWHIWVPETMFTMEAYDFTAAPRMMSRNLGALIDTGASGTADSRSFGLLYEWGRKDPFIGARALGSAESATFSGTAMTTTTSAMSQDDAAAVPTTLVNVNGAWCPTNDNMFWGDLERDSKAGKTIYDPCPPGYRMPARSKYTIFTSNGSTLNGFSYDAGNGIVKIGSPSAVFPVCGYLKYDGSYASGSAIVWNTRNDYESGGSSYCMYISGGETKKSGQVRANAGSVRCVNENADPFQNAEGMPVQQSGYTRVVFDASQVVELSGICFSKDKDFIWGVGDEGAIYKISLDFKTVTTHLATGSDLEDVTLNPNTGDLYFAKEADRVDKCLAPSYSSKQVAFYVEAAANFGNSGLEGIAYYTKDNSLYVGSQSGANLWKYKLDGTMVWNKKLGTIAADIQEVGGLCYDAEKDWLWVTDSEAHKLFVFNGEVTKLLAIYDVSAVGNAESVMVDRVNSCVYVGDDGSTSKIYTYKFTNL